MRRFAGGLPLLIAALGLGIRPAQGSDDLLARCGAYAAAHEALPLMSWSGRIRDPDLAGLLTDIGAGHVEAVLASDDPKVRTLGALALGVGDNPSRLGLLAGLVDDHRLSFAYAYPAHVALGRREDGTVGPTGPTTYSEPWTVARWARFLLQHWTQLSLPDAAAWRGWWSGVEDAETLVSVWSRRLSRALEVDREHRGRGGEGRPALDAAVARLRAERGNELFALVALIYEESSPGPWTERELDAIAREHLTTKFALRCLKREPPFSDPWIQPGEQAYAVLCRRLLLALHFTATDAAVILELEQAERGHVRSLANEAWSMAASRALPDPEAQRAVLVAAFARYPAPHQQHFRSGIACELWRALGVVALDTLLAWYFLEREPHVDSGGFQEAVANCVAHSGADGRRFAASVLADARSRDLPWSSLDSLVRACNRLADTAIVREDELQRLHHPLGSYRLSREAGMADGRARYPEATASVLSTLSSWHGRLRTYVSAQGW